VPVSKGPVGFPAAREPPPRLKPVLFFSLWSSVFPQFLTLIYKREYSRTVDRFQEKIKAGLMFFKIILKNIVSGIKYEEL
jgi:hypothetical protein